MERRKITFDWERNRYQILRYNYEKNRWHNQGVSKSIHGIDDFLISHGRDFEIELDKCVDGALIEYRTQKYLYQKHFKQWR